MDFPGGPVIKNPPCNVGYVDLISDPGTKIPQATEQLNPDHNYCVQHSGALAPQLESPCASTKNPHATTTEPACNN